MKDKTIKNEYYALAVLRPLAFDNEDIKEFKIDAFTMIKRDKDTQVTPIFLFTSEEERKKVFQKLNKGIKGVNNLVVDYILEKIKIDDRK